MIASTGYGQSIGTSLPNEIDPSAKYLFYLHGGIVQEQGANAISKDFGLYEYRRILDVMAGHGYRVISEVRPKGTAEVIYAEKVSRQMDSLRNHGVDSENIIVVGASLGGWITIEIANIRQDINIRYVILALCNEYNMNYFSKYREKLCGKFLSIYERTDQKLSCDRLLNQPHCKTGYKEIVLDMGNGHGFIFKPYDEWVLPVVKWISEG